MRRKLLFLIMALSLVLGLSIGVSAEESDITWTVENMVLTISGTGEVTKSTKPSGFNERFTSVVISEGITGIGDGLFIPV